MKLAVITDSSAYLSAETLQREDLFVLDIPVNIDGEEYVEASICLLRNFTKKWLRLLNCLRLVNQALPS